MTSISIRVEGVDQTGEARRAAAGLAASAGLDETAAGKLAIVVTECANNLWKHAGGGEIVLTPAGSAVEVLALDKGPGMRNVELCFQDGYSTAGSSGTGLGAVRRLATEIDIYTFPDKGTALLARISKASRKGGAAVGGVSVPIRGESVCGDDFIFVDSPGGMKILVVDGLGHGPLAADCASAAVEAFRESAAGGAAPELMREVHGALRATRGAAVAIGEMDWRQGELRYCGIGNIAGIIWENSVSRHLLSHPGIVGHDVRNVRYLTYPLGKNGLILLCSDGITTHWSLDGYPGLHLRDPALIAGIVYRDHRRSRDDATVAVARNPDAA
ncbi:MAG TPA: SpoIIE family protein phosphatase [Limnochordia bacterium]